MLLGVASTCEAYDNKNGEVERRSLAEKAGAKRPKTKAPTVPSNRKHPKNATKLSNSNFGSQCGSNGICKPKYIAVNLVCSNSCPNQVLGSKYHTNHLCFTDQQSYQVTEPQHKPNQFYEPQRFSFHFLVAIELPFQVHGSEHFSHHTNGRKYDANPSMDPSVSPTQSMAPTGTPPSASPSTMGAPIAPIPPIPPFEPLMPAPTTKDSTLSPSEPPSQSMNPSAAPSESPSNTPLASAFPSATPRTIWRPPSPPVPIRFTDTPSATPTQSVHPSASPTIWRPPTAPHAPGADTPVPTPSPSRSLSPSATPTDDD